VWKTVGRTAYKVIDAYDSYVTITQICPTGQVSESEITERLLRPLPSLSSPDDKIAAFKAAIEFATTEGRPDSLPGRDPDW